MATLFQLTSLLVMPFWLLMALAPRWRWTVRIVQSPLIVLGPILLYAALVLPSMLAVLPALARPQLPVIADLLSQPLGTTIAWLHFLAFDLFVARWIFLDARERGLSSWVVSPLLFLTLLFGPLGLGVYLGLVAIGPENLKDFAASVRRGSPALALNTVWTFTVLVAALVMQLADNRQFGGSSVWMKPAKFAAAVAISSPVLAWIISQMQPERRRDLRIVGNVIAAVAGTEVAIITFQHARGVPIHFNNGPLFDTVLYGITGVIIMGLLAAELYLSVQTFRHTYASPARTYAIRLGLAAALAGGFIGPMMAWPTKAQLSSLMAGHPTPVVGAHSVGVPDGGAELPVTHWSQSGGDLRVPHFFGLHALQVFPAVAWVLERRQRRAAKRTGQDAVPAPSGPLVVVAVAWLGIMAVTLFQALRGEPLVSPGRVTLTSAGLVILAAGAVGALLLRRRPSSLATPSERPIVESRAGG